MLGAHAARVGEGAGERDVVAERHFDLTFHVGWVVMSLLASSIPGGAGRRKPQGHISNSSDDEWLDTGRHICFTA